MPANRSGTGASGFGNTLTIAHEVVAGDDRVLFVSARTFGDRVSVTYDGVAMSFLGEVAHWFGHTSVFYLLAPPAGTHNVVVTRPSGSDSISADAVSYTGVDQVTPWSNLNTATADGTPRTLSITMSASGDDVVVAHLGTSSGDPGTVTVPSGQTLVVGWQGNADAGMASLEAPSNPQFDWTTASNLGMVAYVVQAASATGPIEGSGAGTFGALTGSGAGVVDVTGTGAGALAALLGVGAGATLVAGTGAGAFAALTGSGVGTLADPLTLARFRWREDDGSETTATWREVEDAHASAQVDETVRLRVQLQAGGVVGVTAAELRWRKKGTADPWEPVQ